MKKIYLSLVCLTAISASSIAQTSRGVNDLKVKGSTISTPKIKPTSNQEKALPIWENDFSTPSEWAFSNETSDNQDWIITTSNDPSLGYGTGGWVDGANIVSNENGYALYDSDIVGTNGGAQNAYITYVNSIDLSAFPNVTIDFMQRIRKFTNTVTNVQVSIDGGTVWNTFPINAEKPSSVTYEEAASINISSVAGGEANVRIRFQYIGSWDYLWAVDDVAIYEQPENDIQLLSAYFVGVNNEGTEYGKNMINHLDANYALGAQVYNFGTLAQTNVEANGTYPSLTSTFSFGTVNPTDTVTLENVETPTLALGLYDGVFDVVSDGETAGDFFDNNTFNRYFEVTEMEYAQDGIDVYPSADLRLASLGSDSFAGAEDGLIIAAWYHIKETDNFSGVKIMLANGTDVDSYVYAHIIDTANFLANDMTPMYSSGEYYITATDISNGYAIVNFPSMITLNPGCYYAGIECFSGGTNNIRVLDDQTVAQPGLASMIYIPGDQSYTNGVAMGIRLMADDSAVLNENTLEGVNIYPNPSEGIVNISNDLSVENTITVLDLTGKVVATKVASSATTVDLTSVGTGVYLVEVSNANGKKVERVVIK